MIGVVTRAEEMDAAREFFELFKTPWEPAVPGRHYRVVLCTLGTPADLDADVLLLYGSACDAGDLDNGIRTEPGRVPAHVESDGSSFPIYRGFTAFSGEGASGLLRAANGAAAYQRRSGERVIWRIGYDLFAEVRFLLSEGQPAVHAATPTLEWHIEVLRQLLLQSGVSFLEVPPRPHRHDFICCLTHDIDFYGIRRHKVDWTIAGFAARASIGSLIDVLRGRRDVTEALRNWAALLSLPLVHLGLMRDFWRPFESYAQADASRPATFFLVPRRGEPGVAPDGTVRPLRAVDYEVSEIPDDVRELINRGNEVAVHGVNAWRCAEQGLAELKEVTSVTGQATAGVRMHWLYFSPDSPKHLEAAGFSYDSTWGYNDAIGYRAGTSQVFRLAASRRLLELPLIIMDSAMFFAGKMALARRDAMARCRTLIGHARRFGGAVVINWHDRSLAPERLWGRSYQELLDTIGEGDRTWFASAATAVDWFRWRRSIRFSVTSGWRCVTVAACAPDSMPGTIRVHRPDHVGRGLIEEISFDGRCALQVQL